MPSRPSYPSFSTVKQFTNASADFSALSAWTTRREDLNCRNDKCVFPMLARLLPAPGDAGGWNVRSTASGFFLKTISY